MPVELIPVQPNWTEEANKMLQFVNRSEELRLIKFKEDYLEFWHLRQADWDEAKIQNVLRQIPLATLLEICTEAYNYGVFIKTQSPQLWDPSFDKYLDTPYPLSFSPEGIVSVGPRKEAWQPLEAV